jgi:hypothetical protein
MSLLNNTGSDDKKDIKGRRDFLKKSAAAAAFFAGLDPLTLAAEELQHFGIKAAGPWYRTITRWGQVNITEKDPESYDVEWWRKYWKKTNTQGVVINAGGIVAYYPSKVPLHRQATYLKGMDLFGKLCKAAHDDGLVVFARMDSNRAHEEFYTAHPDWFSVDATGKPYRAADLYLSCIFSPYYSEHIPAILTEIATLYKPEGFTDNSWSGIGRDQICYCVNCKTSFKTKTGNDIPEKKDWNDKAYRQWIKWNYERRLEIWDLNNKTTRQAGGVDCIWAGMNSGSISGQSRSFRDYKEICKRADIIMLDHQSRADDEVFQNNTEMGQLIHGILGWEKLVPESMAMYQAGRPTFRVTSKPPAEARMWMINGLAGGIQPWWHHVAAYHEDRRMYDTAAPVMQWQKENEQYLVAREPVASVGIVWSQQNTDFYGRDASNELVDLPWHGITRALVRARIPYLPVNADHIERDSGKFSVLILPAIGSMSESQIAAVRKFVEKGGSVFATGETSLYDEWGDKKPDYALADIFGAHKIAGVEPPDLSKMPKLAWNTGYHTYLRLSPELRSQVDGPKNGTEPAISGKRHSILKGFEKTDILPFGGFIEKLKADAGVEVPMTFIPQFPVYPPETAWMREPKTDIAGMFLSTRSNGARVCFMPADIDKQYARGGLPDHGDLIRNIVNWAAGDSIPVRVEGAGLLNCTLYRQNGRMILHLVNLTSTSAWNPPLDELIAIGPLKVSVKLSKGIAGKTIDLRVKKQKLDAQVSNGWARFTVNSILDHEMIVIS